MILFALALLGAAPLIGAPVPPECSAYVWLSATVSAPSEQWCTIPALPSWPLADSTTWTDRSDDLQPAYDACVESGGQVLTDAYHSTLMCFGRGWQAPCFREPVTVVRLDGVDYPGAGSARCGDTRLELLPRAECRAREHCSSVRFGRGRLWFTTEPVR